MHTLGVELPKEGNALLAAIHLDRTAAGLDEAEVYDPIYNPGNALVLGSWAAPGAAETLQSGDVAGAETVRRRAVRIIRDYGVFDRRETPQYYPDVERRG